MSHHVLRPQGGLPPQTDLLTDRAMFTEAYAVIPRGVPARHRHQQPALLGPTPGSGCWPGRCPVSPRRSRSYIVEVAPGGGSDRPETEAGVEGVLFVVEGEMRLTLDGERHMLERRRLRLPRRRGDLDRAQRRLRRHCASSGSARPTSAWRASRSRQSFVTSERDVEPQPDAGTDGPLGRPRGSWTRTTSRHDMHVNIVTFQPGAVIPFAGDPRHGARPLRPGGQGRLPAEHRLGGGGGRRLHVAAGLLPAGLLRRRARAVPLPALQGRQPAHAVEPGFCLAALPRPPIKALIDNG